MERLQTPQLCAYVSIQYAVHNKDKNNKVNGFIAHEKPGEGTNQQNKARYPKTVLNVDKI